MLIWTVNLTEFIEMGWVLQWIKFLSCETWFWCNRPWALVKPTAYITLMIHRLTHLLIHTLIRMIPLWSAHWSTWFPSDPHYIEPVIVIAAITHPSWMGQSTILATWEVVYYILSGTPRSLQKCFWPHLRVEFSGENHLLLICGKIPNQTVWITKNLDSWLNSDLFKKKVGPNRTCLDSFR